MRLSNLLLLLAPGAVSGAAVDNGTNTCLDPTHEDYSCSLDPGVLTIDMTGCGITDSDGTALEECLDREGLKNLPITFIKLGDNDLTQLPEDIFQPFVSSLQHLHLEGNNLELLPKNLFAGMSSLVWLHLQENSLTALPYGLFDGLVQLQFLNLASNPNLQCVPSTAGTNVQPAHLTLPENFDSEIQCGCPVEACEVDCAPGDQGYVCSGGPTPSPVSTPAPLTPVAPVTDDPVSNPATPVPVPGLTPSPVTANAGTPTPATAGTPSPTAVPAAPSSSSSTTPNDTPSTPTPATPAPTAASRDGLGTDSSTSEGETPMCNNGIPGLQVGDACCLAACSQCGGVECSQNAAEDGLTAAECCVNTIISNGVECGDGVGAPCINYDTPAPTPSPGATPSPVLAEVACSVTETETACKNNSACRQCMYVTTIEQEDEWKDCFEGYSIDVNDPCSASTAMTCCLIEIGDDCQNNELFMAYSECFVEESSGGAECPTPLTCETTTIASTQEGSSAGRLASPLTGVGPRVVVAVLALVGAAYVQ